MNNKLKYCYDMVRCQFQTLEIEPDFSDFETECKNRFGIDENNDDQEIYEAVEEFLSRYTLENIKLQMLSEYYQCTSGKQNTNKHDIEKFENMGGGFFIDMSEEEVIEDIMNARELNRTEAQELFENMVSTEFGYVER
jgi:hypothetical protein